MREKQIGHQCLFYFLGWQSRDGIHRAHFAK